MGKTKCIQKQDEKIRIVKNTRYLNVRDNITFDNSGRAISIGFAPIGIIGKGEDSISIGNLAGEFNQGNDTIAFGQSAGLINQGNEAISIGSLAGFANQGKNAIAIGNLAGYFNQPENSIVINATNINLNGDVSNAFYVKPVREVDGSSLLQYNSINGEISYSNTYSGDISFNGNVDISGNLNLLCNQINDVSGINFCDGTYIGHGSSFDISTSEVLHIKTSDSVLVDGDTLFSNNVKISGNLVVRGTTTQISTQDLLVKDNLIIINQPMDSSGNPTNEPLNVPSDFTSGFVVYRGPVTTGGPLRSPYQFLYNESSKTFQVGVSGEMQPVATREDNPTNNGVAVWDASDSRFVNDRGVFVDTSGNVEISGNLSINDNLINDVSGINFSDGTYIGKGNSFDISTNDVLHIKTSQTVLVDGNTVFNNDISVNGIIYHSGNFIPPIGGGGSSTLAEVLSNGNQASTEIDMSGNAIIDVSSIIFDSTIRLTTDATNQNKPIKIGFNAGQTVQGQYAVAIGNQAGQSGQGQYAVAIGNEAGQSGQGQYAVAIGYYDTNGNIGQKENSVAIGTNAAQFTQGIECVAIGNSAGKRTQGQYSVAIGSLSGNVSQYEKAVAIGYVSGQQTQGTGAIAVGNSAARYSQGQNSVAIGNQAGITNQGSGAVAIGYLAGNSQRVNAIAIGSEAGRNTQNSGAVAIGTQAGVNSQGGSSVAIGNNAGAQRQGVNSVAIGVQAGTSAQGASSVAIGNQAGRNTQGWNAVSIGFEAGLNTQGSAAVAIGYWAGRSDQKRNAVAIGNTCGFNFQGSSAVAISNEAGLNTQGDNAIAIGYQAGRNVHGSGAIAIGYQAGSNTQSINALAIGVEAGSTKQGTGAIAIGYQAGRNTQGANAIAIGSVAGPTNQAANSIAINATGLALTVATANAFYVAPIRNDEGTALLQYNTTNNEITHSNIILGDVDISGNLTLNCNNIDDVSGINFCDGTYIGQGNSFDISTNDVLHIKTSQTVLVDGNTVFNSDISVNGIIYHSGNFIPPIGGGSSSNIILGDVEISGNLMLNCNNIADVSGINFCDGTYIGQGNSFDISANNVLFISGVQDPSGNYNSASIVSKDRIFQQLNPDISWNKVNGFYSLAKNSYSALNPYSSGVKAASIWVARQPSTVLDNTQWLDVCWSPELNIFVAVGAVSGVNLFGAMWSNDGIIWNAALTTANTQWRSVCWSPELGLFVAVALNGTNRVMTSTDGKLWNSHTSASNDRWRSICWSSELRLFVAVSRDGTVMTSSNGTLWISHASAAINDWSSVCWSPELGLFVAVSQSGVDNRVMTSSNGTVWISRKSASNKSWSSVCWSPELGLFVVVAFDGIGNDKVMTSTDGINWNIQTAPDRQWRYVCWSPELKLFVAVCSDTTNTNLIMYSADGNNWNTYLSGKNNTWRCICWSPELGLFASVADSTSNKVMISSLKGRPPTSYNVFDSSLNNIDQSGNWTIKVKQIYGETVLLNGEVEISGNITLASDLTFENNGNNVMTFSDFSSNTQNTQLPSINNQPVSLTRVSIFKNNISYPVPGNGEAIMPFGNIIKNQLNLSISGISGEIISPSLDISGQYVEIYANVEIQTGANNTGFSLDISGVDCSFFEIIDSVTITKKNQTFYLTLGPHMFLPEEWAGCSQFVLKIVDNVNNAFDVLRTKIVFKSYYL